MNSVWLVQDHDVTVVVCDTEATANMVIKRYPQRELHKTKKLIVAEIIGDRYFYYEN
jgi:hypothetical protein